MKKYLFLGLLILQCGVFADSEQDKLDFRTQFRAIHENAVNKSTVGLEQSIYALNVLSEAKKRKILAENVQDLKIVRCENDGDAIRLCTFENQEKNMLGAEETEYNTQVYIRSAIDFVNWKTNGQNVLDKNCKVIKNNFYKTIDTMADSLIDFEEKNHTPSDATKMALNKIFENNKITQPYFTFNIEQDRKVTSYNCLSSSWSKVVTYPTTEKLLDGDCRSPDLVKALGLENICRSQ